MLVRRRIVDPDAPVPLSGGAGLDVKGCFDDAPPVGTYLIKYLSDTSIRNRSFSFHDAVLPLTPTMKKTAHSAFPHAIASAVAPVVPVATGPQIIQQGWLLKKRRKKMQGER